MRQYNAKVEYYTEHVFKKINREERDNINVYIPLQEMRRVIDKANVQYLGLEGRMGSTRSLEKFMSCGSNTGNGGTVGNVREVLGGRN